MPRTADSLLSHGTAEAQTAGDTPWTCRTLTALGLQGSLGSAGLMPRLSRCSVALSAQLGCLWVHRWSWPVRTPTVGDFGSWRINLGRVGIRLPGANGPCEVLPGFGWGASDWRGHDLSCYRWR